MFDFLVPGPPFPAPPLDPSAGPRLPPTRISLIPLYLTTLSMECLKYDSGCPLQVLCPPSVLWIPTMFAPPLMQVFPLVESRPNANFTPLLIVLFACIDLWIYSI